MNAAGINSTFKTATELLLAGRLTSAFDKTGLLVDELQMGDYADKLAELKQNYMFLLQYFKEGIDDPQRKSVYNKLISRVYVLNNELREELLLRNSSNFEFTQKRYFPYSKKYLSSTELSVSLHYYHSQWALIYKLEDTHEAELKRLRSNYETALNELFSLLWLKTHYSDEDRKIIATLMDDGYPGWLEKTLIISALMLNLWRMFDEVKLGILFDACQHPDLMVRERALVALCFVLARHNRFLPYFPSVRNRLVLLADDSHILENFRNIFIQIIATADTDKISRKMQEEILPEMMKMAPGIKDKQDLENLINTDDWNEENPQWQEMMDSSISDKLKELSDLQMEGADVYMSTFSLLKSFPFFTTFSNWFLPFDAANSSVSELFRTDDHSILTAFVSNNVMCNSDKYSFCLSILQMPESQRSMLTQSFKNESEQLDEMARDEAILKPDQTAKNISKQYIQDLFRFFKLFPHHEDFSDMFRYSLQLHHTYLFDILSSNESFAESIAEYYFSKNHYAQAIELFSTLKAGQLTNALFFQKMGYAYQQTSNFKEALAAYRNADIIQPDDVWTVRKMAFCARMMGDFNQALDFYQHVDFLKPDQKSVQMQIGYCNMELGKYKEALSILFKLDALEEEDIRIWRSIAWCSFVTANLSQANYYMKKILASEPLQTDYFNAGHIAWASHQLQDAIGFYSLCLRMNNDDQAKLLTMFEADKVHLLANGIDVDQIPLMIDALNE